MKFKLKSTWLICIDTETSHYYDYFYEYFMILLLGLPNTGKMCNIQ